MLSEPNAQRVETLVVSVDIVLVQRQLREIQSLCDLGVFEGEGNTELLAEADHATRTKVAHLRRGELDGRRAPVCRGSHASIEHCLNRSPASDELRSRPGSADQQCDIHEPCGLSRG